MDLESYGIGKVILDITTSLGWTKLCRKLEVGALLLVMDVYVNLEEKAKDKEFVRGKLVTMTSEAINKLIGAPNHEEDDYLILMDEGVDTQELEKNLCQTDKEVIWAIGKKTCTSVLMLGIDAKMDTSF